MWISLNKKHQLETYISFNILMGILTEKTSAFTYK